MRDYHLHELSDEQFEGLVVHLCRKALGIGTVNFSAGRDAGKDGRFTGTANAYPSEKKPWSGKFIIQAKWTSNPVASCSDPDFENKVIKEEIPRIKALRANGELDNYLMFTNRKLSGGADAKLLKKLKETADTENVAIIGKETITSLLDTNPDIVKAMDLRVLQGPLRIRNQDIKHLIEAFKASGFSFATAGASAYSYDKYASLEDEKNPKNGLTPDYFEYIKDQSEPYFDRVQKFLADPINEKYRDYYFNIVDELQQRLLVARVDFVTFDSLLTAFYDEILDIMPELRSCPKLVSVFLHYMYCNCDIGKK